jgi:hypothetical protein
VGDRPGRLAREQGDWSGMGGHVRGPGWWCGHSGVVDSVVVTDLLGSAR